MARVSGSILRMAPQSGQVTSNALLDFPVITAYFTVFVRYRAPPAGCSLNSSKSKPDCLVTWALLSRLLDQLFNQSLAVAG